MKKGDETRVDLHHVFTAATWMNDAHLTFEDASFGPRPATIGPGAIYSSDFNNNTVINTGGGRDYQDKGQRGWSFQDDLTFYDIEWSGTHTIKTGLKYKSIDDQRLRAAALQPAVHLQPQQQSDRSVPGPVRRE